MIVDGKSLQEPLCVEADLCVVGTGMGGGALLSELLALPIKVVVLEAGDANGVSGPDQAEIVGRAFGLPRTRAVQLGGTINLWHGICAPLDPIDFEVRPWINDSGWPLTRQSLDPFYRRASALLGLPAFEFFQEAQLPAVFKARLQDIQLDETLFTRKLFQIALEPRKLKQALERGVARAPHVRCFTNTTAIELRTDESDQHVQELTAVTNSHRKITVRARNYVLCAGGLETPRLLLNSTQRNSTGLGNEHDLVGRFLADHPQGNLCQLEFQSPQRADLYADMRRGTTLLRLGLMFQEAAQRKYELPNHVLHLRPAFKKSLRDETETVKKACVAIAAGNPSLADVGRVMRHPFIAGQLLRYKRTLRVKYRYADLFCQTEQVPNPRSRVLLSEKRDRYGNRLAQVDWAPSSVDYKSMETTFLLLGKALANRPYRIVHRFEDMNWNKYMTSAAHHCGTARMGRVRTQAVVDENLQIFGKHNVFVCDASVFPTAGNANPSLTTCALAIRLADFLKQKILQSRAPLLTYLASGEPRDI